MNPLLVCKKIRQYNASCLLKVLKEVLEKGKTVSESEFRDKWLKELRKNQEIFPEGWYTPPPHGMAVLFGTGKNFSRTNFESIRGEKYWPKKDVYLDLKDGFLMLYASPVDRKTGIIGDFETTVYFGNNNQIKDHLKVNLEIIHALFDYAQVGMTLSDIAKKGMEFIEKKRLSNNILSINDSTNTNIGHTIPFSYEEINNQEKELLRDGENNWERAYTMISKKRKFVNNIEQLKIKPGMAFTIEPRLMDPKNEGLPQSSFHTIVVFDENGDKELLVDYEEIFKLAGMTYLLF